MPRIYLDSDAIISAIDGTAELRARIPNSFPATINAFFGSRSQDCMRATDETLAMLKWLRQFADAVNESTGAGQK